jgi:transposase
MEETTKSRRRFDKQFKLDAVRLLNEGGRLIAELSRDLGVSPNQLRRWNEKYGKASANPNGASDSAESIENIKLKRELALVTEEREILKKALAVFSRRPA